MERNTYHPPEAEGDWVKTHDYEYAFYGFYDKEAQGRCRVRILQEPNEPPILIITELSTNPSTSVTNMVETLVPELIAKHLLHRYDVIDEDPALVIEHYESVPEQRGRRGKPTYDQVTFASWRPRKVWLGG